MKPTLRELLTEGRPKKKSDFEEMEDDVNWVFERFKRFKTDVLGKLKIFKEGPDRYNAEEVAAALSIMAQDTISMANRIRSRSMKLPEHNQFSSKKK